jgi:hypothetical protein
MGQKQYGPSFGWKIGKKRKLGISRRRYYGNIKINDKKYEESV